MAIKINEDKLMEQIEEKKLNACKMLLAAWARKDIRVIEGGGIYTKDLPHRIIEYLLIIRGSDLKYKLTFDYKEGGYHMQLSEQDTTEALRYATKVMLETLARFKELSWEICHPGCPYGYRD